jgi:hypothetical protein
MASPFICIKHYKNDSMTTARILFCVLVPIKTGIYAYIFSHKERLVLHMEIMKKYFCAFDPVSCLVYPVIKSANRLYYRCRGKVPQRDLPLFKEK